MGLWNHANFGQATGVDGPIKFTYDMSPPEGSPGALVGYLEGQEARMWGIVSLPERRAMVLECFSRYFGPQAHNIKDYADKDWSADEWTRGCYSAHFTPHAWTQFGSALRAPIGCLHWAGTETATQWHGYMEGALQSGERAAAEVLMAL